MNIFDFIFSTPKVTEKPFDPNQHIRICGKCSHTFCGYGNVCPKCGTSVPHTTAELDPGAAPEEDTAQYHGSVLGLKGKVTFADIKQAYRIRMMEYHPDKVASLGTKLRAIAEIEAKRINAAYDYFQSAYGRDNSKKDVA